MELTLLELIKTLLSLLILLAVLNIAPTVKKVYHAFRPKGQNLIKKKKHIPKQIASKKMPIEYEDGVNYNEEEDFDYDD